MFKQLFSATTALARYDASVKRWTAFYVCVTVVAMASAFWVALSFAQDDAEFLNAELEGLAAHQLWFPFAVYHQSVVLGNLVPGTDSALSAWKAAQAEGLEKSRAALTLHLQQTGDPMLLQPDVNAFLKGKRAVFERSHAESPGDPALSDVHLVSELIGAKSKLVLDASLGSYYLMNALMLVLPHVADDFGHVVVHALDERALRQPQGSAAAELNRAITVLDVRLDSLRQAVHDAIKTGAKVDRHLPVRIDQLRTAIDAWTTGLYRQPLVSGSTRLLAGGDIFAMLVGVQNTLQPNLAELLNDRLLVINGKKYWLFGLMLLAAVSVIAALRGVRAAGRRHLAELRDIDSDLRIAATAFDAMEGMVVISVGGVIQRVNASFIELTGYLPSQVVGRNVAELEHFGRVTPNCNDLLNGVRLSGLVERHMTLVAANGVELQLSLRLSAVRGSNGAVKAFVGMLADISVQAAAHKTIQQLAFEDPLTLLPNRRQFIDRLAALIPNSAEKPSADSALLFLDLDGFKVINDVAGHSVGDDVLRAVALRLTQIVDGAHLVYRLGGDEFCILMAHLGDFEKARFEASKMASTCTQEIGAGFLIDGVKQHVTVSVGICLISDTVSVVDAMKHADFAMYEAKAAGKNTYRFFDAQSQAELAIRAQLTADLRQAVLDDQFCLHYQPQVSADGHWMGVEALVRWQHPQQGLLNPDFFIALAEETGLIHQIGRWVLSTACLQLLEWSKDSTKKHLTIAVNISAKELQNSDFVSQVVEILGSMAINPARLKLELTETMFAENVHNIVEKMHALKILGIGLSIDDFGTGYSSLSYLKNLPVDEIKIDKSFLDFALSDGRDSAIVRAIIDVGHSLGLDVVAEGVETNEQRDFLMQNTRVRLQGYLFGKPVPVFNLQHSFIA